MTTPNSDAFKDEESVKKFIKNNRIGFSKEEITKILNQPRNPFHDSPDNPWNQLKKEQEERDGE
jgi:hypothetical protein